MNVSNGGKMGSRCFQALGVSAALIVLQALPAPADIGPSHFYRTNQVNGGVDQVPLRITQAEDVSLDQWSVTQSGPVHLPTNAIPVWWLSARTNAAIVYASSTGTVVSATNGHVQVSWRWGSLIVPAGRYLGSVRAYQQDDGSNTYIGTLAQHYVDIAAVPDSGEHTKISPVDLAEIALSNLSARVTQIAEDVVDVQLADVLTYYLRADQILALYIPRVTNIVAGQAVIWNGTGYVGGNPVSTNSSMDIGTNTVRAVDGLPVWNGAAWPGGGTNVLWVTNTYWITNEVTVYHTNVYYVTNQTWLTNTYWITNFIERLYLGEDTNAPSVESQAGTNALWRIGTNLINFGIGR